MNESPAEALTFEQSLQHLERTVRDLEDGQLGLEESLNRYEQGVSLIKRCYLQLRKAEQRILELTGADENDQPGLQSFQHEATGPVSQGTPRRPRRKPDDPV